MNSRGQFASVCLSMLAKAQIMVAKASMSKDILAANLVFITFYSGINLTMI